MDSQLPAREAGNPLIGPPPPEVPLPNAPLIRVVAQVRFPLVASVEKRDFMAPFQEVIRADYPALRPEESRGVVFGPQGVVSSRATTIWRFDDPSGSWRVSLAPDFLALETTSYTSRNDFLDRWTSVLSALAEHINPQMIDRLGVRYIDRISGDTLDALPTLVRPEVTGVLSTPLLSQAQHAITEAVYELPDDAGHVMTRWGLVPSKGTVDPSAIEPIDEPSWILDVDVFQAATRSLDVETAVTQVRAFAERTYTVFRWVVTDEFLKLYGGEL